MNKGYIKSREIVVLTECNKKYQLNRLSLNRENQRYRMIQNAVFQMAQSMKEQKPKEEILHEIYTFFDKGYDAGWFPLGWQKNQAVEQDLKLFKRFLDNFQPTGSILTANWEYELPLQIICNDETVEGVRGMANLLMEEPDGSMTGIIICRKFKKPFSYRARKAENMVMGSIELLSLLEGLKQAYPERNLRVTMVQLRSELDRAGELAEFEKQKGKNVISFTEREFQEQHKKSVLEGIRSAVKDSTQCKCQGCIYENLCQPLNKINVKKLPAGKAEGKKLLFTNQQNEVVCHKDGPLRVCAGPGSGKTATLVARMEKLLQAGVPASEILAITFTKKAAMEMLVRINADEKPVIATLHALAFHLLIDHEFLIGVVRLASRVDCMALLLRVLNHAPVIRGVSYEGLTMRYGLVANLLKDFEFINRNGEESFISAYPKKDFEGIGQVKVLYDAAFNEAGYITYDAQIALAVNLLKLYPGVREKIQGQYRYIMVDEVQDLDMEQAKFVQLLTRQSENNLMICGDADQSIYSFRGGSNHFMLKFKNFYPKAEDILLEDNFRSSKEIVEMSSALIANNQERIPMNLKATFSTGFKAIQIVGFNSNKVGTLIQDIKQKGYNYSDIAVIATTNKALTDLCGAADLESTITGVFIPMELPKYYLRDDYVFNTILDLLQVSVCGMNQDEAVFRLLEGQSCVPEKADASKSIYADAVHTGRIYDYFNEEATRYYLPDKQPFRMAFGKIYRAMMTLKKPLKEALGELQQTYFSDVICTDDVMEKIYDLLYERKLRTSADLYEFMKAMKVFEDDTRLQYVAGDRVRMLTAHDAKGKEFPVVILYGIDEFERKDVEEDRRLLYVALTRAKKVVFIIEHCPGKSAFLREISSYVHQSKGGRYE